MGPLPFAFSVHHFITSVGADAGFASILGLAILALLYFAHARETAGLREELAEAHARVDELESRVNRLPRPQAAAGEAAPANPVVGLAPAQTGVVPIGGGVPRPTAPASGAPAPTPAGAPAPAPGPAASPAQPLAAPATAAAAATALVERPGQTGDAGPPAGGSGAEPEVGPRAPATAGVEAGPGAPAGTGAPPLSAATKLIPDAEGTPAPSPAEQTMMAAPAPAPAPAPATAAAVGNGGRGPAPTPAPRPAPPPARPLPSQRAPARPAAGAPRRPSLTRSVASPSGPSRRRQLLAAVVALLAVAAVVVILLVLTSTGGSSTSTTSVTQNAGPPVNHHHARHGASPVNPSGVTVAVLNGTATSGLAHRVALKLTGAGFKPGTVATAVDQTRTSTTVAYLPGHRADAAAVAAKLSLPGGAVAPVDSATQGVACPPPAACTANVVVVAGSDLANVQ
jgi:hypothetical protein